MNSGVKGGASRVSIPSSVKKTIEDIKEITSNKHSEDDIYAMLKECAMDPNETTQRLLLLDTFHEVKRRRDRKKENQNKEPEDQKWKHGPQSRSHRGGRTNYISRNASQDAGGGRSTLGLKENASSYLGEKANAKVLTATSIEIKPSGSPNESHTGSLSNGPSGKDFHVSDENACTGKPNEPLSSSLQAGSSNNSESMDAKNRMENEHIHLGNYGDSLTSASRSYLSSLDSQDTSIPGVVTTLQHEEGRKRATFQPPDDMSGKKSTSSNTPPTEIAIFKLPDEMLSHVLGSGDSQKLESLPATSLTSASSAVGRPLNYNDRSQVIGQQKEWKPKSSHANSTLSVAATALSEGSAISNEIQSGFTATPQAISSESIELAKKLKDANLVERKNAIIPEVKKLGFCFGSFDAGFELDVGQGVVAVTDGKTSVLSEPSIVNDEPVKELKFRSENKMLDVEDTDKEYSENPEATVQQAPSTTLEANGPSLEAAQESHQHTSQHTPSSYNIGLMPPIVSSQGSPLESLDPQARDASRLPGFIIPQSFDPASYYAQFYRSGFMDSDGRISPILPAGAVNKYNGNTAMISPQTAQTPPELQGNGQMVFSNAPAQLVTQAAGVVRSSIATTQQTLPIFRHPSGVHLPHYPPNFIPYGPYFSPFYVPPPAIHQVLSNGMFSQQPQSGSLYPSAPGTSSKYSVAQFKQGSNTGNPTQASLPGSYGTYDLSMVGYPASSPSQTVTSSSMDDTAVPHAKENSAYIGIQQNDGSGVWFTTPTADVGSLQASTFYSLPQGQMSFNPTGPGHGAFTGMFHPAQGMAPSANVHPILQQSQAITSHVDMVGQNASAYQQPQPNWPSNY